MHICSQSYRVVIFVGTSVLVACEVPDRLGASQRPSETETSRQYAEDVNSGLSDLIEGIESGAAESSVVVVFRPPIDAMGLEMLTGLPDIRQLELYQCRFSPADFADHANSWPNLERLRLEGCPIDDATIERICQSSKLRILNLPTTQLTDHGFKRITELPNLSLLRIGSRGVSDEGIAALAGVTSLRSLHLLQVPITDEGLKTFYEMKSLESLYIDGGSETEDGIRELLKRNPGIHFHRNQLHVVDDPNADGH